MSDLGEMSKRWRAALATGDSGPLAIAADVMVVAGVWDSQYREQAGGDACTTWLRSQLGPGRGLAWFCRRHEAVSSLGESVRRTMHHEVAVWIHEQVPSNKWAAAVMAVTVAAKKQGGVPLTPVQARRVVIPLIGKIREKRRACPHCGK